MTPTVEHLLDDLADVLDVFRALKALYNDLRAFRNRPTQLNVTINGLRSTGTAMQIPNDQKFAIHVVFDDALGRESMDTTPTTSITASDPSLATVGPHPDHAGDDEWAEGTVTAANGTFTISASSTLSDGTVLAGSSDDLEIAAGAARVARVDIELEAQAPPSA